MMSLRCAPTDARRSRDTRRAMPSFRRACEEPPILDADGPGGPRQTELYYEASTRQQDVAAFGVTFAGRDLPRQQLGFTLSCYA